MSDHFRSFLENEFLTMTIFGALGRSRTYLKTAPDDTKLKMRVALREKLHKIGERYKTTVEESKHLINIQELSDTLSSDFESCLEKGRFRIGIAQKALNLYLKYLWCVGIIPPPPHCPFDSIVIRHLPECEGMKWTSIDDIKDYKRLVAAAKHAAKGTPLPQWELELWNTA
jgi:hypothetical protein